MLGIDSLHNDSPYWSSSAYFTSKESYIGTTYRFWHAAMLLSSPAYVAGKVNPVMPELMALVSYRVIGNDVTVNIAASDGDLQLNAYEPVVGLAIFESQKLLTNTMKTFREKCVDGITINEDVNKRNMEITIGIVTALNPILGHHVGDELAKESKETGKGILELVREKKLLSEEQIEKLLSPESMTGLDKSKYQDK